MAMIAAVIAPATAQAAPRSARTAILSWSPSFQSFNVSDSQQHEFYVTARYYTGTTLHNASFHVTLPGAIYAEPSTIAVGTVQAHTWNVVGFTVIVPAGVAPGPRVGALRLETQAGSQDFDTVGAPMMFRVMVQRQNLAAASVAWHPDNGLGTLSLLPGQSLTESVTFSSKVTLTNAHLQADVSNYAQANGVSIGLPAIASTVPANTPVGVTFTIGVGANARPGTYDARIRILGSVDGGAAVHQNANLSFKIQVQAPEMIYWTNAPGTVSLQPGQTVTVTAAFHSATPLTAAQVYSALSGSLLQRGLKIGVVATNVPATVTPGMVVPVSVAITAASWATAGTGTAYLDVVAHNANVGTRMPGTLTFPVAVVTSPAPLISWSNVPGPVSLQPGQTVLVTAAFQSNTQLSAAQVYSALSGSLLQRGLKINIVATNVPATVAPGMFVPVSASITAGAGATPGTGTAYLDVVAHNGNVGTRMPGTLTFPVAVVAAPVTPDMIYWNNVPGTVSLQPGQTVTVTAAFHSATSLTAAQVFSALSGSLLQRGLKIGVVATNVPATVTPGLVVPVSVAITAASWATAGTGTAYLDVVAHNGNLGTRMPGTLTFPVAVVTPPAPSINWPAGLPASFSITRSASTVTLSEQVTFVSSSTLTNAQLVTTIQPSQSGGPTIVPVQLPANTTIPANTPTKVSVIVSVPPTAQAGLYTGEVYVTAIAAGVTTAAPINTALVYTIAVN